MANIVFTIIFDVDLKLEPSTDEISAEFDRGVLLYYFADNQPFGSLADVSDEYARFLLKHATYVADSIDDVNSIYDDDDASEARAFLIKYGGGFRNLSSTIHQRIIDSIGGVQETRIKTVL